MPESVANPIASKRKYALKVFGLLFIAFWIAMAMAYAICGPTPKYEVPVESVSEPFQSHGPSFGTISYKQQIEINGEKHLLFPTFDNPEKAIEAVSEKCPNILGYLQNRKLILGPLSTSNWKQYQELMIQILVSETCPYWYGEQDGEFLTLRYFFDIYENEDKNAELIRTAEQYGMDAIVYSLPTY